VFFYMHRPRRLTEKDSILLADFVNSTGEPVLTVRGSRRWRCNCSSRPI